MMTRVKVQLVNNSYSAILQYINRDCLVGEVRDKDTTVYSSLSDETNVLLDICRYDTVQLVHYEYDVFTRVAVAVSSQRAQCKQ